jgi:hypothetical protein
MTRKKKPPGLPSMRACPECTLRMEVGSGPHGLAHHECRAAIDHDVVVASVYRRIRDGLEDGSISPDQAATALARLFKATKVPNPVGRPKKEKVATKEEMDADERKRTLDFINTKPQPLRVLG